jgi:serine/threonine protein kinase
LATTPGTRLGPYEVTAQIGVGGMGEVHKATDTNLKRAVAIKALPAAASNDPERLAPGAIPIAEALPIAKQIAEALEAARTGHNNDQGGRQLWIRSDARY